MRNDDSAYVLDAQWSSAAVAPGKAAGAWNRILSTQVVEMTVEEAEGPFSMAWHRYGLGAIDLNFYSCGPLNVVRSLEMVRNQTDANITLIYVQKGVVDVSHVGSHYLAKEGAVIWLDESSAHTLAMPMGGEFLTVRMPEMWLRRWMVDPFNLIGTSGAAASYWSRPLVGMLSAIHDSELCGVSFPRSIIADQIGALTALIPAGAPAVAGKGETELVRRIRAAMAARFEQATLRPIAVAREVGISVRHLHRLLGQAGTSYSEVLFTLRIARAKILLADTRNVSLPVSEIAWLCGFVDSSHFARLFRASIGMSPTAYRARYS